MTDNRQEKIKNKAKKKEERQQKRIVDRDENWWQKIQNRGQTTKDRG